MEKESVDAKKNGRGKSDHGGVYVGETARSLFERAAEHRDDAEKQHDDSHMMKHWILDHQEEKEMPRFKFRMVASFQDSLTRQVAESVRIDMRKGRVLNSKTEYSRCKLPRLTVDLEEWRRSQEEAWQAGKERDRLELARMMKELLWCTRSKGQKRGSH